jgi:U4/U6 small nuclear ribonucleoprotein PRP4
MPFLLCSAQKRLARQRLEASVPLGQILDQRKAIFAELKSYTTLGSQIGDDRAISGTRFSPDSSLLLTGSWTGTAKIWDVPGCRCLGVFKGHKPNSKIAGVAWHPDATLNQSRGVVNFATGAEDCKVALWGIDRYV